MTTQEWIGITGVTGFIGANLILRLMIEGHLNIVLFVRGKTLEQKRNKVINAIEKASDKSIDPKLLEIITSLQIVDYDLLNPNLSTSTIEIASNLNIKIDCMIHLAAMLNHKPSLKETIYKANVEASEHTYKLATLLGARNFIFISTSYVCGKQSGLINNNVYSTPPTFNNYYEESKFLAESRLLQCSKKQTRPKLTIFRPSIVVGHSALHSNLGSDSGLFGLQKKMMRISKYLSSQPRIRINADPTVIPNFISIDHLVEDLNIVINKPDKKRVYTSCCNDNENLINVKTMLAEILKSMNISKNILEYVNNNDCTNYTASERILNRTIEYYLPYMNLRQVFTNNVNDLCGKSKPRTQSIPKQIKYFSKLIKSDN